MKSANSWIRRSTGPHECIEAFFFGSAYSPHRHDTYTLALTTHGVQSFNYRGELRHSVPGKVIVLHPDELHDGKAGTDAGFGYRSVYVSPGDIQRVLGGHPLPFISTGLSGSADLARIVLALWSDLEHPIDQGEREDTIADLAIVLRRISGQALPESRIDTEAVERSKRFIEEKVTEGFTLSELEAEIGEDRWKLSRQFRSLFGTSPYRYLIMRRLDLARDLMLAGYSIADAAHASSFSDQSHFNRHFRQCYGLSPKAWLVAMRDARWETQSFYN